MRSMLTLGTLLILGGCAIIVAPNDGDVQVHSVFGSTAVVGDGNVARETRQLGAVSRLDVSSSLHVDVQVGQAPSLQVAADSNLQAKIRTDVVGDTLRIWIDGNVRPSVPMRVSVTLPRLTQLSSSGSGQLAVNGLDGGSLNLSKSGSGEAQLAGRVDNLDVSFSGSGAINASALHSGNANIDISGSGRMHLGGVQAERLTASLHGSGSLQVSGTAQMVNARTSGSGTANLVGLTSRRADLMSSGSGDIVAQVKDTVVAESTGSGRITVYGNPAQRTVTGKHVQVVN